MKITLSNHSYKVIKNHRDAFVLEDLTNRFDDHFLKYDYILGDYAYGKLRLKGFYKKEHPDVNEDNNYELRENYLLNYCAFDCKHYVISKE